MPTEHLDRPVRPAASTTDVHSDYDELYEALLSIGLPEADAAAVARIAAGLPKPVSATPNADAGGSIAG